MAINESTFYNYYQKEELIPIQDLDNKTYCDCYVAKNVTADYKINTWLVSLGATYNIWQFKKLSLDFDLRITTNVQTKLNVTRSTILNGLENKKENVNILKSGAGLLINYQLNKRVLLGIAPMYMLQMRSNKNAFYSKTMKELILPISINYRF